MFGKDVFTKLCKQPLSSWLVNENKMKQNKGFEFMQKNYDIFQCKLGLVFDT